MDQMPRIALVLSGGNALGAYLAGAYEHLHNQDVRPDWIVGTSIGAVTGAILAGNAPEERLAKLNEFWTGAMVHTLEARTVTSEGRQVYNGLHTALTLMFGRPSIFRDRLLGLWSLLPWVPNDIALYDQTPLRRTLERLVDFDRLNRAEVRFTLCAWTSRRARRFTSTTRATRSGLSTSWRVPPSRLRSRRSRLMAACCAMPGTPTIWLLICRCGSKLTGISCALRLSCAAFALLAPRRWMRSPSGRTT
jgi:predicted acylesterase/phospholipase RssA